MKTKVLYWWMGVVKMGYFVGFKNGNFLIEPPNNHYDHPVESKMIYPYIEKYLGMFWDDCEVLKKALIEKENRNV
jgi:hypothetical protein